MDKFIGDDDFFYTDFFILIKTNNFPQILERLKKKHEYENSIDKDVLEKKHDLIIWNAFLSKEVIKDRIIKTTLHYIYNKFYLEILKCTSLKDLQELEIDLFKQYITRIISNMEVTNSLTVNRSLRYIHMHIENYFSLNKMAKELNISSSYISTLFKKTMGISINEYVHEVKINRAKILLKTTSKTMIEIAQQLGYSDSSHFSKKFKEKAGLSPISYRNNNGF